MISKLPRWIWIGAALLALSAGYVNAVALSGITRHSVSHMTGTVTLALEQLAAGDVHGGWTAIAIVLSFLVGAALSGVIVKNETLKAGRRYGVALLLESLLLMVATYLFGRHLVAGELVAAISCGLQNAMVATYSGSVIRTTHLTGIVSDLGAELGTFLAGRKVNWIQVRLHGSILSCFVLGVYLGSKAYRAFEYRALVGPTLLVATLGLTYMRFILPHPGPEDA